MKIRYLAGLLSALLATPLHAHSGHGQGGDGFTLLHYLSEAEHVAALVLLPLLALVAGVKHRQQRRQR